MKLMEAMGNLKTFQVMRKKSVVFKGEQTVYYEP
jgi:hypothetical protein